jgi:Ca2+-binding EF-hand superfamily protein
VLIDDNGTDGKLNFKQFAKVLSTFRRTKDSESKLKKLKFLFRVNIIKKHKKKKKIFFIFFFKVYDRDCDDKINKSELLNVLHMMVGDNIPEDQLTAIAERTITELDSDNDMVITFDEFCKTLEKIDIDDKMSMKFLA